MRVHVELTHRVDVAEWGRRHAAGEVPDAAPYGLDRLERAGVDLSFRPAVPRGQVGHLVRGAVRRVSGGLEVAETLHGRSRRTADVVLCWDERTGVPAALRSRLPGEPPAVTGVIWMTEPGALTAVHRRVAARSLRRCRAVWALSSAQVDALRTSWRLDEAAVHWLRFGVDAAFWTLQPDEDAPSPGRVLAVGNDRHRDHALVVEGVRRARRVDPGLRLDLVTSRAVPRGDVPGDSHLATSHAGLRHLYGRAFAVAVALHQNLHVSGITVALEAMACGRPVVISNTPGMADYVEDGVSGLLVPPGDVDAMSGALLRLAQDPAMAAEIGAEGRRRVRARFSSDAMMDDLAGIVAGVRV